MTYPPFKGLEKDDVPFPQVGYVSSLEGIIFECGNHPPSCSIGGGTPCCWCASSCLRSGTTLGYFPPKKTPLFVNSTSVRLLFINSCLIKLASFKTFQAKTLWKSFDLSPHLSATFAGLQNSPFTPWRSATQSRPCCLFALEKSTHSGESTPKMPFRFRNHSTLPSYMCMAGKKETVWIFDT